MGLPVAWKAGFVGQSGVEGIDYSRNINPDFDPMTNRASPYGHLGVNRGIIVKDKTANSDVVTLRFLYNPTRYAMAYQMNGATFPAVYLPQDQNFVPNLITGVTLSFTLLFDRVAESWKDPKNPGVFVDLAVLENVCGVLDNGVLNSYPVSLYFANQIAGPPGATSPGFAGKFYGVITSVAVDFLLYNKNMIPTQCFVNITMEQRWQSTNASGTAATPSPPGTPPGTVGPQGPRTGGSDAADAYSNPPNSTGNTQTTRNN